MLLDHMPVKHIPARLWSTAKPVATIGVMETINSALGKAIAQLRLAAGGMNQTKLAELARTEQPSISKIERGKQEVGSATLERIARAVGVKPSNIWALAESLLGTPATQKPIVATRQKTAKVSSDDISALQWVNTALIGYLLSREPAEAGGLITALEAMPEDYQRTGLGGTILSELDGARAYVAAAQAKDRPSQPHHKTVPSSRRSRP